ncbi:MAG: acyl carrier protein [Cyclobacteriaceae bacterium]|nr:acyl carrier protein [Cyclobacteriaceae bacterium]
MNHFTETELVNFFKLKISEELGIGVDEIDPAVEFINFGLDSVKAIFILQHLEHFVGEELNPLLFWDYPTIQSMAAHLTQQLKP